MSTRVLVTGASGQVGLDLTDTLAGDIVAGADATFQPDGRRVTSGEFDVIALTHHDFDVSHEEMVQRTLAVVRPDVVVNLAAYTAVDRAEGDVENCRITNTDAVGNMSRVCAEVGAHLITISTDYVFDGTKGAAYVESDPCGPLNVYGSSKFDGERLCRPEDTIVRTSWVTGVRGSGVAHVIAQRAQFAQPMRFVNDQRGTLTSAADLARVLVTMIRERPGGVWHIANGGDLTWFELARAICGLCGGDEQLVSATTTDELVPVPAARRPQRSDLSTAKWIDAGYGELPAWRDALGRFVRDR